MDKEDKKHNAENAQGSQKVSQKEKQRGSALVYILIAIALLAALTATFMEPSSQQTTSQNTFNTVADLKGQADFIRSAIQECVFTYPSGESGLIGTENFPYPINPSSTYLATASPDASDRVRYLRCPGNPGTSNDHAEIFTGRSGKFMPPSVDLFTDWFYHSGVDGVFFWTSTDKSDAFLQTSMERLDELFSECEADVIDASGGTVAMTSTDGASDPDCADGSTCFRVWMITNAAASTAYQAGGAEATAGCP